MSQMWGGGPGQNYAPLGTNVPFIRQMPFQGVPFLGSPIGNLFSPFMVQQFGNLGMTPIGIGTGQNIYDTLLNQRHAQMQLEAMRMTDALAQANYLQTARGAAAVFGVPWTAERQQAASTAASWVATVAPLVMSPSTLEDTMGGRGHPANLARALMDAGRYRLDPVTGRLGMTGASAGAIANQLYAGFYHRDDISDMGGLRAMDAGELTGALTMRGLVGSTNPLARETQIGARLDTPEGAGQARALDADRIKRQIDRYKGVTGALRDIFGPQGSVEELFTALDALTAGGVGKFDPEVLKQKLQGIVGAARAAGVSLPELQALQERNRALAVQHGLDPTFANEITRDALNFSNAYRLSAAGETPGWRQFNTREMQSVREDLTARALASNMAQNLGALRHAGLTAPFRRGTQAAAIFEAIRANADTFLDPTTGRQRGLNIEHAEMVQILARGGNQLNTEDARNLLAQNQEQWIAGSNISGITQRAQGGELAEKSVQPAIQQALIERLEARIRAANPQISQQDARARATSLANRIAPEIMRRAHALSSEEFQNPERRLQAMSVIVNDEVERADPSLMRGLGTERTIWARQTGDTISNAVETSLSGTQFGTWGNARNAVLNQRTFAESERLRLRSEVDSRMRDSMRSIRRDSPLSSLIDALQAATPGDPSALPKALAALAGGVNNAEIVGVMRGPAADMQRRIAELQTMEAELAGEPDTEKRRALEARIATARSELTAASKDLADLGERFHANTAPSGAGAAPDATGAGAAPPIGTRGRGPGTSGLTTRTLLDAYTQFRGVAGGDEAEFRRRHGLQDDKAWTQFKSAAELEHDWLQRRDPRTEMAREVLGSVSKRRQLERLRGHGVVAQLEAVQAEDRAMDDLIGRMATAGAVEGGAGGAGGSGTMTLTGTVTLVRDANGEERLNLTNVQGRQDVVTPP